MDWPRSKAVTRPKPSSGSAEEDRAAPEKSAAAAQLTIANRDTGCTALRTAVGLIDELEQEADHQVVIHDWECPPRRTRRGAPPPLSDGLVALALGGGQLRGISRTGRSRPA